MARWPPNDRSSFIELRKVGNPAMNPQVRGSILNSAVEQANQFKTDMWKLTGNLQNAVEPIKVASSRIRHVDKNRKFVRQRRRLVGDIARRQRHPFAGQPKLAHLLREPLGNSPMVDVAHQPWIRFAAFKDLTLPKDIAASPVHDQFLFLHEFRGVKKFPHRHASANLINQVAFAQIARHGSKVMKPLVRVVAEFPAVSIHQFSKHSANIQKAMDENAAYWGLRIGIGEHFKQAAQDEMGCIALFSCSGTILPPFAAGEPKMICSQRPSRFRRTRDSLY